MAHEETQTMLNACWDWSEPCCIQGQDLGGLSSVRLSSHAVPVKWTWSFGGQVGVICMLPIATSLSTSICNHISYTIAHGLNSYNAFLIRSCLIFLLLS